MSNVRSDKRFLLFGGNTYYPLGGWYDIYKGYDTLKEAVADAKQTFRDTPDYEWWHVYDKVTDEVVDASDMVSPKVDNEGEQE
jgi:hypothetical protein